MLQYLLWLFAIILYSPIFYQLYSARWETIDYTHAYFILPVSLWLVWRKRKVLSPLTQGPKPSALNTRALFLLVFGLLMFIFGWRKDYLFVSTLSLIPVLFGLTLYLYGAAFARAVSFPIYYLLLLVPPPLGVLDAITLPMRYGASIVAYLILKSFYLPFTRDGLLFSVEGQQLFLGPACSGFRSLIAMISLGLVYVYLNKSPLKKKIILLLLIVPLALLGNLVRVIVICLVAYYFGQEAAEGFFHNFSGYVVFIVTLLGLMGVESFLYSRDSEKFDE